MVGRSGSSSVDSSYLCPVWSSYHQTNSWQRWRFQAVHQLQFQSMSLSALFNIIHCCCVVQSIVFWQLVLVKWWPFPRKSGDGWRKDEAGPLLWACALLFFQCLDSVSWVTRKTARLSSRTSRRRKREPAKPCLTGSHWNGDSIGIVALYNIIRYLQWPSLKKLQGMLHCSKWQTQLLQNVWVKLLK